MEYQYLVDPQCYDNIYSFYHNVALKYRHTYSEKLMNQNIEDAVDSIYQIEIHCIGVSQRSKSGRATTWRTPTSGTLLISSWMT